MLSYSNFWHVLVKKQIFCLINYLSTYVTTGLYDVNNIGGNTVGI